jgi:hypothetical protein
VNEFSEKIKKLGPNPIKKDTHYWYNFSYNIHPKRKTISANAIAFSLYVRLIRWRPQTRS